jgi:hypothetical protein
MKQLIEYIVKNLVEAPQSVNVSESRVGTNTQLDLRVAKEDVGRVIGRKGQTIKAIRQVLNTAAAKYKIRAILNIAE